MVRAPSRHLVSTPVDEHKQSLTKWVQLKLLLYQYRQTIDVLPEVHRLHAQVHRWQRVRWPHHGSVLTACNSSRSAVPRSSPPNSTTAVAKPYTTAPQRFALALNFGTNKTPTLLDSPSRYTPLSVRMRLNRYNRRWSTPAYSAYDFSEPPLCSHDEDGSATRSAAQ